MKYLFLFLILCSPAFAIDTENYVVEKPDGSVAVVHYLAGTSRSIESILDEQGLLSLPIYQISNDELKKLNREDRKYWKKDGNKIVVDSVKKLEDEAAKLAEDQEKDAVLAKLKITEEEAKVLGKVIE